MRSYSDPTAPKHYMLKDDEWITLFQKLGRLCHYAAWNVAKSNKAVEESREDIEQECFLALIRSLMYFKRQTFIIKSFEWLERNEAKIPFQYLERYAMLCFLWNSRKQFSGKNGFLDGDEELAQIISSIKRPSASDPAPDREAPLEINEYFMHYAKAIIWRAAKNYGIEIKKEKDAASRNVSLAECEFLDVDFEGRLNGVMAGEQITAITRNLGTLPDKRPLRVFEIATQDHDSLGNDGTLRKGHIRRSTKMAYHTIRKQLKVIRNAIQELGGVESVNVNRITDRYIPVRNKERFN